MADNPELTEQLIGSLLAEYEKGTAVSADALAGALKAALDLIGQLREDVYQAEYGH
jgi:hypothetical protein